MENDRRTNDAGLTGLRSLSCNYITIRIEGNSNRIDSRLRDIQLIGGLPDNSKMIVFTAGENTVKFIFYNDNLAGTVLLGPDFE